jgi:hypothetical protein
MAWFLTEPSGPDKSVDYSPTNYNTVAKAKCLPSMNGNGVPENVNF